MGSSLWTTPTTLTPLESWEVGYNLTLMSAVRLARAALPHLKQSGRGRVVNITSMSVRQSPASRLATSTSSAPTAGASTSR